MRHNIKANILWNPVEKVGGDFCWSYGNEEELLVAVYDCAVGGVTGAFISQTITGILNISVAKYGTQAPARLIDDLHSELLERVDSQRDQWLDFGCHIVVCRILFKQSTVQYCSAGIPFYVREGMKIKALDHDPKGIGSSSHDEFKIFRTRKYRFEPGAQFILMTDGIANQKGGKKGLPYGRKKLIQCLKHSPSIDETFKHTQNQVLLYQSDYPQTDDQTLVILSA